jgi:hypothetical protein
MIDYTQGLSEILIHAIGIRQRLTATDIRDK